LSLLHEFYWQEKPMSVFSVIFVVTGFNALLFAALMFRRPRPDLRARMFAWVVHTKTSRRAREHAHHLPA
jgi:hypothetical protein